MEFHEKLCSLQVNEIGGIGFLNPCRINIKIIRLQMTVPIFMDGADQQTEYEYDENGNLTKDLNKKISRITYNFLNLPKEIMFMDGSYIHYTYDAAGTLLRKGYYVGEEEEQDSTLIDYCGNCIYENGTLKTVLIEGGYITFQQQPAGVSFLLAGPSGQQPRGSQRRRTGGAGEPLLSLRRPDGREYVRRCATV